MLELLLELRKRTKDRMDEAWVDMKGANDPEDQQRHEGRREAYEETLSDLDGRIIEIDPDYEVEENDTLTDFNNLEDLGDYNEDTDC